MWYVFKKNLQRLLCVYWYMEPLWNKSVLLLSLFFSHFLLMPWNHRVLGRPGLRGQRLRGNKRWGMFSYARALLLDGTLYLAVDVCTRAQSCVISGFFFSLCLDVSVVAVSVIHGEQLHISLREKPTHENVGENDVKESAWVTARVGENGVEAERAARNAENYQGKPQVVSILLIYSFSVRVMWPQTSAKTLMWPTTVTQICTYNTKHNDKNCKRLECGAFRAHMELLVEIFLSFPQWMCGCVRLPALCVVYTHSACNWIGSSYRWCLFWGCSGDYISEGVQIPAARYLGEKGFLWYAPDQQWDARVAEAHAGPRAEKTEQGCSEKNITYPKSTLSRL